MHSETKTPDTNKTNKYVLLIPVFYVTVYLTAPSIIPVTTLVGTYSNLFCAIRTT